MKKIILALLAPLLLSLPAHALVELRAGYGINTPSDKDVSPGTTLETSYGFNLDAIVEIPLVPVGLGLRYENMGFDVKASGTTLQADMTRLSAIVNYRIIDLFLYLGPIATLGLSNDVKYTSGGTEFTYKSDLTYSVGVEGGVSLGLIMLGAEVGYFGGTFEPKSPASIVGTPDADTSGIYAKAIVGVGF
ncbi:MAG: hypothetical protein KDD33_09655 [Bdellovibrionales bacterium]|nr:hypothetical protein [Bdellovibrionales bacterium]